MPSAKQNELAGRLAGIGQGKPPRPDEIEISIFGPGYGESILLHLGDNYWFIVDSCIAPVSSDPVALCYLQGIGLHPAECVRQVIATHWHDDHIRGLARILAVCSSAEFVYSAAIRNKEFLKLVELYTARPMMKSSGVDEFGQVFRLLTRRAATPGHGRRSSAHALMNRILWEGNLNNAGCKILALSPSDAVLRDATLNFARLFPQLEEVKRRLSPPSANATAVVLFIIAGGIGILLGADLEETGNSETGWSVILNHRVLREKRAQFFKVPHHGSQTAHHPDVWSEMLETHPVAVLTPYGRGRQFLPLRSDVTRICSLTPRAYVTAGHDGGRRLKRESTVDKTIRETVKSIRLKHASTGQVRVRCQLTGEYEVELFGDAMPLRELYHQAS